MRVFLTTACIIIGGVSASLACEQGDKKCGADGYVLTCNCLLRYDRNDTPNCSWISSLRRCSSIDQDDSVPEPNHVLRVRVFGFDPIASANHR